MSPWAKASALLVGTLACVSLLASCGGSSSAGGSGSTIPPQEGRSSAPEEHSAAGADYPPWKVKGTGPKPKLHYPSQPPRHVVFRVLKEGSGPRARPGEELAVRYMGGDPKTKFVKDFWSEEDPYRFRLGDNYMGKAWEIGLKGMRLGGRRELVIPSRLAYGEGMMVFVIELLEVEAPAAERQG